MTKRNINCSHPQQNVLLSCWARRQRKPRWNLRWIRAARAALLTRFAAKPQTSLRQGVITNDRRASRHQARTRPLASTRRAGRRPRSGSISPVTACDVHASTKHRKRGYRHIGPSIFSQSSSARSSSAHLWRWARSSEFGEYFFSYSLKAALNGVGAGTFHPPGISILLIDREIPLPFAYACWCSGLERLVGAYILENNFTILRCLVM
jgi:hypothetical protein